jgi:hypothetical protein
MDRQLSDICVNGFRSLPPTLDDASVMLDHAHAVLAMCNIVSADDLMGREVIRAAYEAAEQLLENAIRHMRIGHADLQRRAAH